MTATDELRRLLDERGVEWSDNSDENVTHTTWDGLSCWFNEYPDGWTSWGMAKHGTPEQAIEATLGRTCHVVKSEFDELDEYPHTWLSCGHHTMLLPNEMQFCPQCGAKVLEPSSNLLGHEEGR